MTLKFLLCTTICFSLYIKDGISSYMGNETFLRQNIEKLLKGTLKLSDDFPYEKDELEDTIPKNNNEYDFIVIGAGSAGATIASRLSEIKNLTVLLIEAGGKEYSIVDIPSLAVAFQSNSDISWNFETESSNKYCLAQKDHKCSWPRGKIMGGSSSLNYMLAMRGDQRDYDEWASETGDNSWSYKSMLKYFKKLEDLEFDQASTRTHGPVHITEARNLPEIAKTFVEAAEELRFNAFDYDAPEQAGITYLHSTIFNGERWSSNRAYLRSVKDRKNLILTQYSHVHKILIDKVTKNAYGVRYSKNGEIYEVRAKKEVILCAGAVNSPQILMLSGVGPEKHLRDLNIDVIKDAPVGQNLIDHVYYGRELSFNVNDSSTIENVDVLDVHDPSIKDYIKYRNGTLSYSTIKNALLLFNTDDLCNLQPNLELVFSSGNAWVTNESTASEPRRAYGVKTILMKPRSRGRIILRSNDPLDKPKIYPNYLEDPGDVRALIKGIRIALKFSETIALKRHASEFQPFLSTCDIHEKDSDAFWECELRQQTSTSYHPAGTCRMGREDSRSAVVDTKLKVIGVSGLRVADASIMPNIVCAHINIPVIAIGEKAADLVKMQHGYR